MVRIWKVVLHQKSTYESKCFFFFFIAAGFVICQPAEGHRFEPVNFHQTREIRTFYQTVMGSDLLFLWEKVKSWRQKPGGLLTAAILLVFYANALSKAALPTFRLANASFVLSSTFRFYSLRSLRDSGSNRKLLLLQVQSGLY